MHPSHRQSPGKTLTHLDELKTLHKFHFRVTEEIAFAERFGKIAPLVAETGEADNLNIGYIKIFY